MRTPRLLVGGGCVGRDGGGFTADKNDKGEWPLEGNYYLALLQSRAYPVPESQVQAIDRFEKGWLVVDAQWLQIVGDSPRSYKLLPEKRTLVVSEMIRLSTIVWDKIDKRSPRLTLPNVVLSG